MKLYLSMHRVPELSQLEKNERQLITMYYLANKPKPDNSNVVEGLLVGAIIFGQISGLLAGAIVWGNLFWGPILGSTIALTLVMCVSYLGSMHFTIPRFRAFLQEDHAKYLLHSLRRAAHPQETEPRPTGEAVTKIFQRYEIAEGAQMAEDQMEQLINRVTYENARSGEVMELAEDLAIKCDELFDAANQNNKLAWQALKSFRLGRFLRLAKETNKINSQALRLLRHSGELLQQAEQSLDSASVILNEVGRNLEE